MKRHTQKKFGWILCTMILLWQLFIPVYALATDPLDSWHSRVLPLYTCCFESITCNNGTFVAVGWDAIITSQDGISWTQQTSGTSNILYRVAFINNTFYAVGYSGTMLTSPNGVNWTGVTSGTWNTLNDIVFGNGTYIAVGDYGTILTSTNGASWTLRSSPVGDSFNSIAYGNGTFVVVSGSGNILTSPDGDSWTQRVSGWDANIVDLKRVIYNNGIFLAVGYQTIVTSPDGVSWASHSSSISSGTSLYDITFGNGIYVTVALDGTILSSPDAISWTSRHVGASDYLDSIAFGNSTFVIVGTEDILQSDQVCSFSLSPASYGFSPSSSTGSIAVTSQSGCSWTATSNNSWIYVTAGSTGQGNGMVSYYVDANTTGFARKGTITIGWQTFTVYQVGSSFIDDPQNALTPYINAMSVAGITHGCNGSSAYYCISDPVTRSAMAVFIIRALYGDTFDYTQTPYFTDVPPEYGAFSYIQKFRDVNITQVTGTYDINGIVTRSQMAVFIVRALYGDSFEYTQTPYFTDVPPTYGAFSYIQKFRDVGITQVTGEYRVDETVTRDQMAVFLARAFLGMP